MYLKELLVTCKPDMPIKLKSGENYIDSFAASIASMLDTSFLYGEVAKVDLGMDCDDRPFLYVEMKVPTNGD